MDNYFAVVTGGASGIGRAIARELIVRGAQVIVTDIDEVGVTKAAREIGAIPFTCDVSRDEAVRALADFVRGRFPKLDLLCNNAGVGPGGAIEGLTVADWRWIIDINLFGVIHGITHFLPFLRENDKGGFILNTASAAAFSPPPLLGAYAASKAAIVALTETFNIESAISGSNVRAGILAPGPVATNIMHSSRFRSDAGADSGFFDMKPESLEAMEAPLLRWLEADYVATHAVDAILQRSPLIATHAENLDIVRQRHAAIEQAYADAI